MLGSVVLNAARDRRNGKVSVDWPVIGLMLLSSFFIAISGFFFKDAALESNYWGTAIWMNIGMAVTGMLVWAAVPQYRREFNRFIARRDYASYAINAANELVDNFAVLGFYAAIVRGPSVAVVQSTNAYQPFFVLIIGVIVARFSPYHKRHLSGLGLAKRFIGIAAIVGGSVMFFL
jgi:hypothetical protein